MKKTQYYFYFSLILLLSACNSPEQKPKVGKQQLNLLKLNENSKNIKLNEYLYTWRSQTYDSTLSIPNKVEAHLQEGFNARYSAVWTYFVLEFTYTGHQAKDFYFVVEKPTIQHLVFQLKNKTTGKILRQKTTGIDSIFAQRGEPYRRNFAFPVEVLPQQNYQIILVAHSGIDSLNAQLMFLNTREFADQKSELQIGIIIGAFLVAFLIAVIVIWGYFGKHQESKLWLWYLSYPVYIVCSILNALSHEGFTYEYFWSDSPAMAFFSKTIFLAIGTPALLIFTYTYLKDKEYIQQKWTQKLLRNLTYLFGIEYLFLMWAYFQGLEFWVNLAMQGHGILVPAIAVGTWLMAGYHYFFKKRKDTGYLVLALSPILLGLPVAMSYTFLPWADRFQWHPRFLVWYFFLAETLLMALVVVRQFFSFLQKDKEKEYDIKQQDSRIEEQQSKLERLNNSLAKYRKFLKKNKQEIEELLEQEKDYQKYKDENLVLQTRIEEVEKRQQEEQKTLELAKQTKSKLENKPPAPSTKDREVFGHIVNILKEYPEQTYKQFDKKKIKENIFHLLKTEYKAYQKQDSETREELIKQALYTCTHIHSKIPQSLILERKTARAKEQLKTLKQHLYNSLDRMEIIFILINYYRCECMISLMQKMLENKVKEKWAKILESSGFSPDAQGQNSTAQRYFIRFYGVTYNQYYISLKK